MSMCYAGAKNNTEAQLKQLLGYSSLQNEHIHNGNAELTDSIKRLGDSVAINVANKIFPKHGFNVKQSFVDLLRKFYNSDVQTVNYDNPRESAKIINDWVEAQTNSKIKNLVSENVINDLTRLILVNAIYFKGNWLHKFDAAQTYKEQFRLNDGTTKTVDMMKLLNKKFKLHLSTPGLGAAICEFPYAGEKISMTIVLPHDNNIDQVQKQLTPQVLNNFFNGQNFKGKVHLYIPKFKFEESIEVSL